MRENVLVGDSLRVTQQRLNFFMAFMQNFSLATIEGFIGVNAPCKKENDVLLLQPEAVAQNIQAFVIPVTGGLLK